MYLQLPNAPQLPVGQRPAEGLNVVEGMSSTAHGTPYVASVSQRTASPEKTWMDEHEADFLAEEVLRDASSLGVSKAVTKQEHGVYVVTLTWRGSPLTMKTPQQWQAHLEQVRPMFEKQRKGESNGTTK